MGAGSRIAVEIDATSAGLQEAVDKAADSLKTLGEVLAKQSSAAIAEGEKTVKLNADLGKSYEEMASKGVGAVRASTGEFVKGVEAQVAAGGKFEKALESEIALLGDFGAALKEKAGELEAFSYAEVEAYERAAAAAREASAAEVESSERTVEASSAAAAGVERSAARIDAAHTKVASNASKSESGLSKFGKDITLGLLGAAGASTYLAVKFQENTQRLQTQAGATAKQLGELRAGMLAMSGQVGFSPDELSAGMYHVVSSMNAMLKPAQRVSAELHIMKVAAEGAQVGGSDLEDTSYALASAMNALGDPAKAAGKVMGELNAIVGSGDMSMQQLLDALKTGLIPSAKESGVSLQSLGAALATMGDEGQQGAIAGTRLRMALALMSGPSEAAAKVLRAVGLSAHDATSDQTAMADALKKAGVSTTQLSADLHQPDGILVAMDDLKSHLTSAGLTASGTAAVMTKAFGGGRTGAGITELAQQTDRLNAKFKQIGASANDFGHDWTLRTHTAAQELHDFVGGIEALGVQIGTDLLPYLEDGVHDLSDFVHWIEQGSTAAHELEIAVGALATVAIGTYLISKLQKAIGVLKEFRTFVNNPLNLKTVGTTAAADAGGGGLPGTTAGGLMIGGARSGYGLPGSVANPIIVAIEAGEYASLGSMGAPGTVEAETGAVRAETGAVKEVEKSPALASPVATGAEEEIGLAGLKSGLNDALSSVMKGGMIAVGGSLVSQLVGSLVKGSAGKTISRVGTDASVGAGVGSVFGPEGTAGGAAIGAIYGGIKTLIDNQKTWGDELAAKVTKGGFGASTPDFSKALAAVLDGYKSDKNSAGSQQGQLAYMQRNDTPTTENPQQSQASQAVEAQIEASIRKFQTEAGAQAQKAGTLVAKQLEAGWAGYKFEQEPVMIAQLSAKMQDIPPEAQAAAAASALAFAKGLQDQGKLAPGSVQQMIGAIEDQFPGLTNYMGISGTASASEFTKALDLSKTQNQLHEQLDQMRGDFPTVTAAMDETSGNMQDKAGAMIAALKQITENGTGPMRQQATADIAAIQQATTSDFTAMTNLVVSKQQQLTSSVKSGSAQAASAVESNFGALESNIESAWQGGVINTSTGIQDIAKGLNSSLAALGAKPIPTPAALQWAGWSMKGQTNVGAAGAGHIPTNATGGYIGQPGQRGRDEVLTVLGRGEAVLNHPQQQVANQFLSPIGGLPGLFSKTAGTLHYMASGGIAGGGLGQYDHAYAPGVQLAPNVIAAIAQAAGLPGVTFEQISEGESSFEPGAIEPSEGPSNVPGEIGEPVQGWGLWQITTGVGNDAIIARVGGTQALLNPIINAQAAKYIYDTQGIAAWHGTKFLTESDTPYTGQSLGTIPGVGGAAGAVPALPPIPTPKMEGAGAIVTVGQAALNAAAKAANAYVAKQAAVVAPTTGSIPSLSGLGGAGGAYSGTGKAYGLYSPSDLGTFDGKPVADWIIPELTWARAHGWQGQVESGWRSPTQVVQGVFATAPQGQSEHQYDIYPGGAVDVTDYQQFAQVIAAYPGTDKLIQLGIDPLHFSGTGHAGGGFVGLGGAGAAPAAITSPSEQTQFAHSNNQPIVALPPGVKVHGKPLFTAEGSQYYNAAFKFFSKYAIPNPHGPSGYMSPLSPSMETRFEQWVSSNHVPFDPYGNKQDYDMRGFWLSGNKWAGGSTHFPDTWKTPYDTMFSRESQYATGANPFDWVGNDLVNMKTGQLISAQGASGDVAVQADIAKTTLPSKVIKPAKTPAIKPQKPAKVAKPKFGKAPTLRLPPGFTDHDANLLSSTGSLTTQYANLQNWYSYLTDLYGDPSSAEPTVTVTNGDGSQDDEINWGSDVSGTPLTAFTGLPDATTGQPTKGIYDWIRDIGTPPGADWQSDPPMTLLGVNVAIENVQAAMVFAAAQAQKDLAEWLGAEKALEKVEQTAVGWIENAVDPQFPVEKMTTGGLQTIFSAMNHLAHQETGIKALSTPVAQAKLIEQRVEEYKDELSAEKYLTTRKDELSQERTTRDAAITAKFVTYRADIEKLTAKQTFNADTWMTTASTDLDDEQKQALAGIPETKPTGWVGSAAAWDSQRQQEEADIEDEFENRKLALTTTAKKNSLTGQLSKIAASTKMTLEENSEKTALSVYYDALGQSLSARMSNDETIASGDRTYIDSVASELKKDLSNSTSAVTGATTSGATLDLEQYTNREGTFAIGLMELNQITIPGLIASESALLGTTLPPATSATDQADQELELAQEIALQASEAYALSQAQASALASMIPEIPAYEDGGPTVAGLSMLHDDEYVVPKGGALVSSAGGGTHVTVQQHFHGGMGALADFVDQRISHPDNVRVVSRAIGQRTSQLAGAPGGYRGRKF